MPIVNVRNVINVSIGVSRESARLLADALPPSNVSAGLFELDFQGVEGMAPSFLDELFWVLDAASNGSRWQAVFVNLSTEFSSKFQAIARSRNVEVKSEPRIWSIERLESPSRP